MKYLAVAFASATLALGINYAQAGPAAHTSAADTQAIVQQLKQLRTEHRSTRSYLRSITDNTYWTCTHQPHEPFEAPAPCKAANMTQIR